MINIKEIMEVNVITEGDFNVLEIIGRVDTATAPQLEEATSGYFSNAFFR